VSLFEDLLREPPAGAVNRDVAVSEGPEGLLPMTSNLFGPYRALALETLSGLSAKEAACEQKLAAKVRERKKARDKLEEISSSWSYRIGLSIVRPVVFLLNLFGLARKEGRP
jgi:hypothetical protein